MTPLVWASILLGVVGVRAWIGVALRMTFKHSGTTPDFSGARASPAAKQQQPGATTVTAAGRGRPGGILRGLAAAADGTLIIAGQVGGNLTASLTQAGPRARRAMVTVIARPMRSVNGATTQASLTAGQFSTDEPKHALRRASVRVGYSRADEASQLRRLS